MLTPKQKRFAEEYAIDCNGTQAAIRAGYSPKTATKQACRLLVNAGVSEAIQTALAGKSERTHIDADWTMQQLKKEATLTGEGSTHAARVSALSSIARCLGMYSDKMQLTGSNGGPIQTEVKQGFDGDLTPYLDIVKRLAKDEHFAK